MVQDKKNLDIEFPLIVPKISSDIIFSRINADFDHQAYFFAFVIKCTWSRIHEYIPYQMHRGKILSKLSFENSLRIG